MNILENLNYYQSHTTKPSYNLALEDCLLEYIGKEEKGIFMIWQNSPAVIIGRHQNAYEEVHLPFLKEKNIALVRRNTGGGAVYHDLGNLNFSFIIPNNKLEINFSLFLNPIIKTLKQLNLNPMISGRNDILLENKKISGSAQTRTKNALLHHGTLMLNVDFNTLEHALAGNPDKYLSKGIPSIKSRVANLKEHIPENTLETIIHALKSHIVPHTLNQNYQPYTPPDHILKKAHDLDYEKYENPHWTFGKSPAFTHSYREKFPFGSIKINYRIEQSIIKDCSIEGDFFPIKNIQELENSLTSIPYEKEKILKILAKIQPNSFFLNSQDIDITHIFIYNL